MSNFFGTALAGGSVHTAQLEYDGPVYEGYKVEHGGEFAIAMESHQDQLDIIAALAVLDVNTTKITKESASATTDEELSAVMESMVPVLEASGGGVFAKIKNAIKTLWGKVKAFFASVIRSVDGVTKSAQDFVKKYKKQIESLKLSGMKYEMYNYTVEDLNIEYKGDSVKSASGVVSTIASKVNVNASSSSELDDVQKSVETFRDQMDDRLESFRGAVAGGGKLDGEEFRKAVRKKLRGGKDDKEEVNVNIHTIITEIQGTSKLNTKISKVQKDADKVFSDSIKLVDDLEKAINKGNGKADYKTDAGGEGKFASTSSVAPKAATLASLISRELSAQQAIVNTAISEWTSAVKERDSVYKKVIMKAFTHKPAS